MLSILLNGEKFDLFPDTKINLIFENPLFLQDRIPQNHSLTFSLRDTPRNLSMLGNPNRLQSKTGFKEYTGCNIRFGPIVMLRGNLVVTKWDGVIRAFYKEVDIPSDLLSPADEADVATYDFGTDNTLVPDFFTVSNPPEIGVQFKELIQDSIDSSDNFVCAPIRNIDQSWPDHENEALYPEENGFYASQLMYFNFFNPSNVEYLLDQGSVEVHSVVYPYPFLHYVIDKFFGGSLLENPFTVGHLAKLVLTSPYHPNYKDDDFITTNELKGILCNRPFDENTDLYNFSIDLADNLVTAQSSEVLKNILRIFCATLFISPEGFSIKMNKDILSDNETEDWTEKLINEFAITEVKNTGYKYGYSDYPKKNNGDGEYIISSPDFDPYLIKPDEGGDDQVLISPGGSKTISISETGDLYKVTLYERDPGDPEKRLTEIIQPNFGGSDPLEDKSSSMDMTSDISPLPMCPSEYWLGNDTTPEPPDSPIATLGFGTWFVPHWSGDRFKKPTLPNLMIYNGLAYTTSNPIQDPSPHQYPQLSNYVPSTEFDFSDFSLHWDAEDGLIENYHTEFKSWVEKNKKRIEAFFLLTASDIKKLNYTKKKHIKGMNFYIEKVEVSIGMNSIDPASATLIEA